LSRSTHSRYRTRSGRAMESAVRLMPSSLPSGRGLVAHASAKPHYRLPAIYYLQLSASCANYSSPRERLFMAQSTVDPRELS
jgi:hypothetical protein